MKQSRKQQQRRKRRERKRITSLHIDDLNVDDDESDAPFKQQQQPSKQDELHSGSTSTQSPPPHHSLLLFTLVCRPQIRFFEQQRQEHKLGVVLVAISVLFICCHAPSVIPDLYEVMFCPAGCHQPAWMPWVIDLSHLLVCVNSSANFLIYMLGGEKFRRAFVGTFFPCCVYSRSPNGSNGDFQASFYSGRTMVDAANAADGTGRANGRVNRSHSGRGRQAQRRTMSLREVGYNRTISTDTRDTIYEAENATACNGGVGEAAAAAVEMTRLCPNGLSAPNKGGGNGGLAGSFRSERAIRISDDGGGGHAGGDA